MGLGPKQRRLPPPAILRGFYPHPIFAPNKRAQTTVLQSGPGTQTEDRVWKVWLRPVTLRVWKLEGLRARWLQEGLGSAAILTVRLIVGVDVNRCPPPRSTQWVPPKASARWLLSTAAALGGDDTAPGSVRRLRTELP